MHGEGFFYQALVYLAAAVISVPIANRLGLGSVLGCLIAGFIIDPYGLGLIGEEGQDVMHFAEFGVIMMLFLIGLELQPQMLWRLRGPILGMGGLQVAATTFVISLVAMALGLSLPAALAAGMILSLSSTAIVLQTLNEKGLMQTDAGQSTFSVLLFQDIAVIPMLAIMPLLAVHAAGAGNRSAGHATAPAAWVETLPGWAHALVVLGAITAIVVAGTAAYRLGAERHNKLKSLAAAYNLRLADILTAFFRHSMQAYQDGKLKIRREPVATQMQVKGWSE